MYKISLVVLSLAVFCAALPLDPVEEYTEDEFAVDTQGLRFRRVTCDLLSVQGAGFSVGHAACAAHCIAMMRGFRGGRCIDGVCNCRR